jgi:hypothetical protein
MLNMYIAYCQKLYIQHCHFLYILSLLITFGANIYKYKDKIILPLQPVLHYVTSDERVNKKHFKKSHILGILNDETMMIEEVFGHYRFFVKFGAKTQFLNRLKKINLLC